MSEGTVCCVPTRRKLQCTYVRRIPMINSFNEIKARRNQNQTRDENAEKGGDDVDDITNSCQWPCVMRTSFPSPHTREFNPASSSRDCSSDSGSSSCSSDCFTVNITSHPHRHPFEPRKTKTEVGCTKCPALKRLSPVSCLCVCLLLLPRVRILMDP